MCDTIQKVVHEMVNETEDGFFGQIFPVFDTSKMKEEKPKDVPPPLSESEKKSAQKLLMDLRKKTGHPSNSALAGTLKHRGAHYQVIEMARHHVCQDCQEPKMAPLHESTSLEKSEALWEVLVMDNAEFPTRDGVLHCMIRVDEASRLVCPHYLSAHRPEDSRNATGVEVVQGVQDTWVRHYGSPAVIRLDFEGAFRAGEFQFWCPERGIEVLPCAAEAHGQIGIVERAIQSIKATVRQLLQSSEWTV